MQHLTLCESAARITGGTCDCNRRPEVTSRCRQVLDRLDPAERLAFVLHDMFAVSFDDEIASTIGRATEAGRQLASRARRRVQGAAVPKTSLMEQRRVVDAFLGALRRGDFEGLVAVLDPDVVVRIDEADARPAGRGRFGAR